MFVQAYNEYYSITIDTDTLHDFLCDSESLLNASKELSLALGLTNSSHCLASDYDLERGIVDITIATLVISFKYLYVKSHQEDDATEIRLLPWAAQMNVHANTLPTDYLDNYSEPSKIVPFVPAYKASSLTINGETITRRFAQRLRKATSSLGRLQEAHGKEQLVPTYLQLHQLGGTRKSPSHSGEATAQK